MEKHELVELLSIDGLRLLDSLPKYESTADIVRTVAELRAAGHSPGLVATVLTQAKLRAKGAGKFGPFADRMLSTVVHADAATFDLSGVDGVYLDPARRNSKKRLADPADWTPSLDLAFGLAERMPTGIKLGPGIDRGLIPPSAEAQWVSVDREAVELGVWFGALARPGIRRAALVLGDHGAAELSAGADSEDAEVAPLGAYVYEPDGAVIRARLIGDLARSSGANMLSHDIAYLTADARVDTPFASRFRVLDTFPLDVKKLRREVAARGIGILEIKKRGVDIDPALLRTQLSPKGDASATLILTRVGGKRVALLTQRD